MSNFSHFGIFDGKFVEILHSALSVSAFKNTIETGLLEQNVLETFYKRFIILSADTFLKRF